MTTCMTAATQASAPFSRRQPLTDWTTVKSGGGFEGDETPEIVRWPAACTLKDHLEQLAIAALNGDDRLICLALIDAMDEGGYLRADLAEIARGWAATSRRPGGAGRGAGLRSVGVGARDLAECLGFN